MPVVSITGAAIGTLDLPFANVEVGCWRSSKKPLEFPGVDGAGRLDMGRRYRSIRITGFIPDAVAGTTKGSAIEELDDSVLYTLATGIDSRSFPSCELLDARTFNWRKTCGSDGALQSCEYSIDLQQIRES